MGDLIREGVTGVSGHVAEPYLQNTVRPDILFPAYLSGLNLAEAFYMAMPGLSWENIVIGDPLCAPFRDRPLAHADIDEGMDERTGLPRFFSTRRVAAYKPLLPGIPDEPFFLTVKADTLTAKGDIGGARVALEEATRQAPRAAYAQLQLALRYQQEQKFDLAVERYRRVVELQPRNGIALNNLAYSLATRQNAAAEALPLAQRALATAPMNPAFLDTVAWIEHLLGRHDLAARGIALAIRSAPSSADLRLHAAIINAAAGAVAVAEQELQAALKLQPSLEGTSEVKELRDLLQQTHSGSGSSSPTTAR
jgi:tetratricopeptide (TPR) repeat protein